MKPGPAAWSKLYAAYEAKKAEIHADVNCTRYGADALATSVVPVAYLDHLRQLLSATDQLSTPLQDMFLELYREHAKLKSEYGQIKAGHAKPPPPPPTTATESRVTENDAKASAEVEDHLSRLDACQRALDDTTAQLQRLSAEHAAVIRASVETKADNVRLAAEAHALRESIAKRDANLKVALYQQTQETIQLQHERAEMAAECEQLQGEVHSLHLALEEDSTGRSESDAQAIASWLVPLVGEEVSRSSEGQSIAGAASMAIDVTASIKKVLEEHAAGLTKDLARVVEEDLARMLEKDLVRVVKEALAEQASDEERAAAPAVDVPLGPAQDELVLANRQTRVFKAKQDGAVGPAPDALDGTEPRAPVSTSKAEEAGVAGQGGIDATANEHVPPSPGSPLTFAQADVMIGLLQYICEDILDIKARGAGAAHGEHV